MRRIRIKKKSKKRVRIKRPKTPRGATVSRLRIRRQKAGTVLAASRTLLTKPRKGRKIVVRKRRRSVSRPSEAKRAARSRREINVFAAEGYQPVGNASRRQAKLSSRHLIEINRFLRTGDTEQLEKLKGKRIAGIELLTDPKRIREFADADDVRLDGLYRDQRGHGRRK
jgi:hypothetical protein